MTLFVRYRLQMLSSGLTQRGEDDEGINGFLPADINIELARAAKMVIYLEFSWKHRNAKHK